jgi:hypothetical protein
VQNDRVFVLIRRSQMSGFQDEYLAALDARTGKPLWRRYLSSAVAPNRSANRPMSQMLLSGGRLYLADNLGAVTCVRARDGVALWTNVLPDRPDALEAMGRPRPTSAPWQVGPPVLVEAGLIVPSVDTNMPARLLDPATGKKLRDLTGSAWAEPDYLIEANGHVLSVGPALHLLDGKTLEIKWTRRVASGADARLQGRAAVTADSVIVPLRDRLEVLSLADGQPIASHAMAEPGSVLPLPDQLVITDLDAVRSHMPWDVAYATLQKRMEADKTDPMPALALAHLATNANQPAAVLQGVDAALESLRQRQAALAGDATHADAAAAMQHEVFRQMLDFATRPGPTDATLRRALFDRLPAASGNPADEVAYRFAFGAFLEGVQPTEAADHYQAILMDPTLAGQLYQRGVMSLQAGLEARRRLKGMVATAGQRVYERYDAAAAQRLAEVTAGVPDPAALLEIAKQYPVAQAAPQALLAAGERMVASGNPAAAVPHLKHAFEIGDATVKARAAGAVVQAHLAQQRAGQARHWLLTVRRRSPELQPIRDGQPVSTDAWLAELAGQPQGDGRLASLDLPLGSPVTIEGRLLVPTAQSEETWPTDSLLVFSRGMVRMLRTSQGEGAPAGFAPVWELPIERAAPVVLRFDQDQVVLWYDHNFTAQAIDARTGKPAWEVIDAKARLAEVGDEQQRRQAANEDEKAFMDVLNPGGMDMRRFRRLQAMRRGEARDEPSYFVKVNESVICLADRTGR